MAQSSLRIARPDELDPLGEALSAFGIGLTLVDREMQVRWANRWIQGMAQELSCGGSHCFAAMWKANQRCPDCLPLLVFRTGDAQEGVRERGRPGSPVEAYRVRAVPVADAAGDLRWVAESFVRLSGPGAVADLASSGKSLASEAAAASGAAFVVVDAQERIVSWGPAAAEVFGWALDEALGRRIDLLVPAEKQVEERAIAGQVAREGRFPRTETLRRAKDGRLVPVALSAVALRDEAGALIGRSCAFEDLSALHQLRGRLAAQEQLLAHVTREAADAILGVGRDGRPAHALQQDPAAWPGRPHGPARRLRRRRRSGGGGVGPGHAARGPCAPRRMRERGYKTIPLRRAQERPAGVPARHGSQGIGPGSAGTSVAQCGPMAATPGACR